MGLRNVTNVCSAIDCVHNSQFFGEFENSIYRSSDPSVFDAIMQRYSVLQ